MRPKFGLPVPFLILKTTLALAAALILSTLSPAALACAQAGDEAGVEERPVVLGYGGQVLLSNSGFGLGGYFSRVLNGDYAFVAELTISSGRDEREVAFFDRFGQKDVPNKANYLLLLPLRIGLEKRLFREKIEDNFRPFLHVSGGPTFGWKFPYFGDDNGNQMLDPEEKTFDSISALPKGSLQMGLGGTIAIGAHFGKLKGSTHSIRIGYSFTRFLDDVQLLERSIRPPTRFFGTPVLLVSFGTLR